MDDRELAERLTELQETMKRIHHEIQEVKQGLTRIETTFKELTTEQDKHDPQATIR